MEEKADHQKLCESAVIVDSRNDVAEADTPLETGEDNVVSELRGSHSPSLGHLKVSGNVYNVYYYQVGVAE